MDKIQNTVQYQNLNLNKKEEIDKGITTAVASKEKNDDEKFKIVSNKYSIELCGAKKNTINTQKGYDAFREACSEFGYVKLQQVLIQI